MAALMTTGAAALQSETTSDAPLRVGVFSIDATPPIGSPLAYGPAKEITAPLSCRGVALLGEDRPIVLCAVDWIGIGNDGQKEFRESLAKAAGTSPDRVTVHALHQHCAPRCDFSTERLLAQYEFNHDVFDAAFARDVIRRAAAAVAVATDEAKPVTHLGFGQAVVEKVASNRRILGADGKVKHMRWTSPRSGELRALPAGTIDPMLRMISLWDGNRPLVALSYYAVHPVSHSEVGEVNTEFAGIARDSRQKTTGVVHVHFTGAAGNLNASKWNDGSPENRQILADRVAAGMARAWLSTTKTPVNARDLDWKSLAVSLPPAPELDESKLLATLEDKSVSISKRSGAAGELIWLRRCVDGDTIDVSCLRLGKAHVLHLPGELFVEYQLAAQKLRPDLFVAMAAYGDYGTGYIGTKIAYSQGGYETRPGVTHVAPEVEGVLMDAITRLLNQAAPGER
jgi:hypothetical protein